jgi:FkbM family methyltransferase
MRISPRAFLQRLSTYPLLMPIMPLYYLATDKKPVLDAFYFVRGFPHGYLEGGTRIASYNGLKIAFPFEEDPSFDDVWLRNVYYPYQPRRDHVVMDVGAHMGFFTLKIARKVARVIAVEPDPTNFEYLRRNVNANGLGGKVAVVNLALGEKERRIFLDRDGYGFGRTKTTSVKTGVSVRMTTIDRLVDRAQLDRLDVIKIDTEGSELEILKSATATLRRYKPDLLLAAYHFDHEFVHLARFLKSLGYAVSCYSVPLFLSSGTETYLYASV